MKPDEFLHLKNILVPLIRNIEQIEKRDEELILIQKEHSKRIERKTSQFENPLTEQDIRNELFSDSFFTNKNKRNIYFFHYNDAKNYVIAALLPTLLSTLLRFLLFPDIHETSNYRTQTNKVPFP